MEFQYFPADTFPGDVNVRLMSHRSAVTCTYMQRLFMSFYRALNGMQHVG